MIWDAISDLPVDELSLKPKNVDRLTNRVKFALHDRFSQNDRPSSKSGTRRSAVSRQAASLVTSKNRVPGQSTEGVSLLSSTN
jgi:hypothetical protein